MNKNQVKTQSELNSIPTKFCVYKTILNHNGTSFTYYGKQSFTDVPDPLYIGSGRLLKEKLAIMSDSDLIEKEILCVFEDEDSACFAEWETIFNSRHEKNVLNISVGGTGGNLLGRMNESDFKARSEKISKAQIGKKLSPETIKKMSLAKLGKKRSPEACKAISEGRKGLKIGKRSAETIARMKAAQQARRAKERE
ncbi:NUMOD3 domain-containing DNA-binding protein [Serratia marcescens]|uniref:NUMOD3 domain-containing DNA-binding protein n=1 Tax=Serratia marcescens TaxID=615 RepID=UPI001D002379|nr:NUMOD3 domain-containing DNA-binding protein [Serratia marcescens]